MAWTDKGRAGRARRPSVVKLRHAQVDRAPACPHCRGGRRLRTATRRRGHGRSTGEYSHGRPRRANIHSRGYGHPSAHSDAASDFHAYPNGNLLSNEHTTANRLPDSPPYRDADGRADCDRRTRVNAASDSDSRPHSYSDTYGHSHTFARSNRDVRAHLHAYAGGHAHGRSLHRHEYRRPSAQLQPSRRFRAVPVSCVVQGRQAGRGRIL